MDKCGNIAALRRKLLTRSQGIAVIVLSEACLFLSLRLFGQRGDPNATQPPSATLGMSLQELQLLRHDLRKQKQKLIAETPVCLAFYLDPGSPILVPMTCPETIISTRLFCWRPCGVSLLAIGAVSPNPREEIEFSGSP
jgi:hypothetical protein